MKTKKIPMRTCVVSRKSYPKQELMRIVINKEGIVSVDPTGRMNGRGAYVFLEIDNIKKARKKKTLEKVLKTSDIDNIYTELEELCNE